MNRVVTAICCLVLSAGLASGYTVEHYEKREGKRIGKGYNKGQLTPGETRRLLNQQSVIDTERRQAMADGKMTKRERQDIRHDQKRLSQDIYHKRHNKKRMHH